MKNVIIKIIGTQGLDGEEDVIELSTEGTLEEKDGQTVLTYEEGSVQGMGKSQTKLFVSGDKRVIMERTGEITSKLVIEKGKRNSCFYGTPHGDLMIGIYGEEIKNSLTEKGGNLKMSYTIDANMQTVSRNKVDISVREV